MFKRKIYNALLEWKNSYADHYACLIEGARRVGKTTVAEAFARSEYRSYLKVDFSNLTDAMLDIFRDIADIDLFFARLQLETGIRLYTHDSCIIFDEVQLYPKARQAIKHLVADGRYHYIETGSLLSIKKNVKDILIPSEEHKIEMYPMDYEEFCWATGSDFDLIRSIYLRNIPIGESTNRSLMRKFRIYLAVGGMPQAVEEYVRSSSFENVDRVKREIISLYKDDLMKTDPSGYTSIIYESVPSQLALKKKRFVISRATGKRTTAKDRERLFDLLNSKTVIPCYNITKPDISLTQTLDLESFKLYMSDVGLFTTQLFNSSDKTHEDIYRRLLSSNLSLDEEYLYENAVAQAIASSGRKVFYHTWQKKESTHYYEVDFLINEGKKISAFEVKSSSVNRHCSLDAFAEKYSKILGRCYILSGKDVRRDKGIYYKPIYMTSLILENA